MTTYRQFEALLRKFSPELAAELRRIFQEVKDRAILRDLEAAVRTGSVEAIVAALSFDPGMMNKVHDMFRATIASGAGLSTSEAPSRLRIGFNSRHRRAEAAAGALSDQLRRVITGATEEAAREALRAGIEHGRGSRQVALDIIGVKSANGKGRQGGMLGMDKVQLRHYANAIQDLDALDPRYLNRKLRNVQLDGIFKRAKKSGKPISALDKKRMLSDLAANTIKHRAETIAITEAHRALNLGRYEGYIQMVEQVGGDASMIELTWQSTPGRRTRDSHRAMNGQTRHPGEPFVSPLSGAQMLFPGDLSYGAPGSETIRCRCTLKTKTDWSRMAVP